MRFGEDDNGGYGICIKRIVANDVSSIVVRLFNNPKQSTQNTAGLSFNSPAFFISPMCLLANY